MTDRPTRLVRARDLVKGTTIVDKCDGDYGEVTADKHAEGSEHWLTVLDAEIYDGKLSAICVSESGEQCGFYDIAYQPVRVFTDSMPQQERDGASGHPDPAR